LWLFSAAIEGGLTWLAVIGVINGVISLSYYWKIMRAIYFAEPSSEEPLPTSAALNVALGVTIAGVLLIGVFPAPVLSFIEAAAQAFFAG
jgi:NADH-quinone oxidoreductase subunit N